MKYNFAKAYLSSIIILLFSIYCLFLSNVDVVITLVLSSNLYFIQKRINFLERKIKRISESLQKANDKKENETGIYRSF